MIKLTPDPANGELLGNVPDLSKEEVLQAVKAAEEAFPAWSNTPPKVSQRAATSVELRSGKSSDGVRGRRTSESA